MRRPEFIAEQSRRPRGALGWVIGKIMSHETSALNAVVLEALDIHPSDRLLEVGFGHGKTISKAAHAASEGLVTGIDYSETMVAMASRTCSELIAAGRVQLEVGDSSRLRFSDGSFDKAYAVHTLYFWSDPLVHLREIRRVLRPGGRFVLGFRTMAEGSGSDAFPASVYKFYSVERVRSLLVQADFSAVRSFSAAADGSDVLVAERS